MIYDVIVAGGGPVGLAFALSVASDRCSVAVVEPAAPAVPADAWDARIYAISPGSVETLVRCGAWTGIPGERVMPVDAMSVTGDDGRSSMRFDAYESGVRALAYILEAGRLQAALWDRALRAEHISVMTPRKPVALRNDAQGVRIDLDDGSALQARLIVGSDGAHSWVREQAGIASDFHDYRQQGVVANFECERYHEATAFQWFRGDSVLALLPLPGRHVSMVWSSPEPLSSTLKSATADALGDMVTEASAGVLGRLRPLSSAVGFPLRLRHVRRLVAPRVALIGDAAHNVHPLAGQGVNLGFRDARTLANVLIGRGPESDCGDIHLLRRYERSRREDIATMQATTHLLGKLFAPKAVWLAKARNWGLSQIDGERALKRLLVTHAMG